MFIQSEDAQAIVNEIKNAIHRDLNIMNDQGIILASTDPERIGTLHKGSRLLLSSGDNHLVISEDCQSEGTKRGINLPIHVHGQCVGVIGITGAPDEVSELGTTIQKMTEIMLIGIQRQKELSDHENAEAKFIERWLFGDKEELANLSFEMSAKICGIDLHLPRVVCVLGCSQDSCGPAEDAGYSSELQLSSVLRHIKSVVSGCLCSCVKDKIVLLFSETNFEKLRSILVYLRNDLRSFRGLDARCGLSSVVSDYHTMGEGYKQALSAYNTVSRSSSGHIAVYDETSPLFLIQNIPENLLSGLERNIFQGCSCDEKAELLETLRLYFKHNGNISQAASEAFVHPNTFSYRLNTFARKTKLNPRNPQDLLTLSFLYLYEMIKL